MSADMLGTQLRSLGTLRLTAECWLLNCVGWDGRKPGMTRRMWRKKNENIVLRCLRSAVGRGLNFFPLRRV